MDRDELVERVLPLFGDVVDEFLWEEDPDLVRDAIRAALAIIEPAVRADERRRLEEPLQGIALAAALRKTGAKP